MWHTACDGLAGATILQKFCTSHDEWYAIALVVKTDAIVQLLLHDAISLRQQLYTVHYEARSNNSSNDRQQALLHWHCCKLLWLAVGTL